ncbi:hypothetical protein ACUY3H_04535 [Corynebacterium ureicelerivorans]
MKFQVMPELSTDEYAELKADIARNGVVVPVLVDEDGNIIDGHNRVQIASELRIPYPVEMRDDLDDAGKRGLAFALNLNRRHLNREQRRALIAKSLKADPQLSNREHAQRTGTGHPLVQKVRSEMESDGQLEQCSTRISADGRERPASQPERKPITDLPATAPITPEEVTELENDREETSPEKQLAEPAKEHRRPLTADALAATVDLTKAVNKWTAIAKDDRLTKNKEKVSQSHLADLIRARDYLTELINNLGN